MRLRSQAKRGKARVEEVSSPSGPSLLNAFYDRDHIVLVRREGDRVRYRRAPCEYSCFIRSADLTRSLYRQLRMSQMVQSVKKEGKWTRILWSNRDTVLKACILFAEEGIETFEGGVSPIRRYCADHNVVIDKPRRVFLDIETDSRVPPTLAKQGEARVLCWALVRPDGAVRKAMLAEDSDEAEFELLLYLWESLEMFDQVVSWSGLWGSKLGFDASVIIARASHLGLMVNPDRWLWLDHLELFRKMNTMAAKSGAEKQSFKLEAIAQELLGEGKDDFDASKTWEAYIGGEKSRKRMLRYCVKDTDLLRRIDEKTGYIDLLQTLCEVTGTFPDSHGMNPGAQVDNFMLRLALERDHRFPSRVKRSGGGSFKGAFVMEPAETGIVKNVHVADFSSLYPSIIITWNMSPETKRDPEQLNGGDIATAALTEIPFDVSAEGLLPAAVNKMLTLRKEWSNLQASLPPNTPEWVDAGRRSTAYKIATNSFYGVIGAPFSRFFDRDIGESVTQCGVWLIQETIKAAEDQGMRVVYGDTDSLFVAGATKDEFAAFVDWCNGTLYPRLLKERGCKENRINLGYEKEFERIVIITKKRYCGKYLHYKGEEATEDSEPEVKGLEYKRGDTAKFTRDMQEQVVNLLMSGCEDPKRFEDEILKPWQDKLLNQPLELDEVVVYKRLSKPLDQYVRRFKDNGEFRRDLPHIEMARVLESRGEEIAEGVKIGYVCVDGGRSPKEYIPAQDWDGTVDRYELWDKTVWPASKRLLEAAFPGHDWSPWKRTRPRKRRGCAKRPPAPTPKRRRRKLAKPAKG